MAVELGRVIPSVVLDPKTINAFFYIEKPSSNQRGGWWLGQIEYMNMVVPLEFRDVSSVEIAIGDETDIVNVQPIIGTESNCVALIPLKNIRMENYRVGVIERAFNQGKGINEGDYYIRMSKGF